MPLLLLAIALTADPAWPHVRGPGYDGHAAGPPLAAAWPAAGPPVVWRRPLGEGYAGFAIDAGRAITLTQSRTGLFVVALDASTGADVWRTRVGWPWQPGGAYPGPYASPTPAAGRVFYATPTGQVGCLDAATGSAVWAVELRSRFGGRGTEFGCAATPAVEGGRVFLPVGAPGASVVALDAATGATVWAVGDDPASYCPALPVTLGGRRLVVGLLRNALVLHDAATGAVVARHELSEQYDEHSAWPLIQGDRLFVAGPFRNGCQLLRFDAGKLTPAYLKPHFSNDVCSSVLADGRVYGFDLQQAQSSSHRPSRGRFKCLDYATGRQLWETDRVGQATALVADGKLVLLDERGTLILAQPSADEYRELCRAPVLTGGLCWTPPALADGRLFVRNHGEAACLDLRAASDPAAVPAPPVVVREPFDWGRLLGAEPAFPHDPPTAGDVGMWFAGCVAAVVLALPVWRRPVAFAVLAAVIGAVLGPAIGVATDRLVVTWPVTLYALFRLTVAAAVAADRSGTRGARWLARLAVAAFALACYGFYQLALAVGYVALWGFLAGLLPAAPFAVAAAVTRRRWWDAAGFVVYVAASGAAPTLKEWWG